LPREKLTWQAVIQKGERISMLKSARFWFILAVGVIAAVLMADWMIGVARLSRVNMDVRADPEVVVADGKNKTTIMIRVSENGHPRSNDLIQLWLKTGSGLIIPNWVFTNENGVAEVTYTPNPFSPYDPQDAVTISILNTSIGRLVEVDKEGQVQIKLQAPD
jgi:hypothetical protein